MKASFIVEIDVPNMPEGYQYFPDKGFVMHAIQEAMMEVFKPSFLLGYTVEVSPKTLETKDLEGLPKACPKDEYHDTMQGTCKEDYMEYIENKDRDNT